MSRNFAFDQALLARLAETGWRRIAVEDLDHSSWWSGEVWELVSLTAPRGLTAYLSLETGLDDFDSLFRVYLVEEWPRFFAADSQPVLQGALPWPHEVSAILDALARYRGEHSDRPDRPLPPAALSNDVLEAEWQNATDIEVLLRHLHHRLSERKFRLFACACCRRIPTLMDDVRNIRAIEAAERYADGLAPKSEMKKARKIANLRWLNSFAPAEEARLAVDATLRATLPAGRGHLCALLRDSAGNPYRPVPIKPSWLRHDGGAAERLARAIYEDDNFADLPILADALEDAGCAVPAILDHCRAPGEHARGCWLVDACLGKK